MHIRSSTFQFLNGNAIIIHPMKAPSFIFFAVFIAVIVAGAGIFWYAYSPISTVARLERALLDNNRVVLRELIDFSAVRKNLLESTLSERFADKDPVIPQKSVERIRELLSGGIDVFWTPAGLIHEAQKRGRLSVQGDLKLSARNGKSECCSPLYVRGYALYYKSLNVFAVHDGVSEYVFVRDGFFSWRLIEMVSKNNRIKPA